jgi:DNA-binding GntR family transcriptional regulator
VTDALIDSLRGHVLDGDLGPGRELTENDVAVRFGVSRPTARVAITHLVQEGLLRRNARRPATVPRLSADDVGDLFTVRIPLELEAVRLVGNQVATLAVAALAVDEIQGIDAAQPHSAFVAADLRFHRALVDGVRSPRLARVFELLSGEIHLSMVQSRSALGRDRIASEHRGILRALRVGDHDRAVELMRAHLVGARDAMIEALRTKRHADAPHPAQVSAPADQVP